MAKLKEWLRESAIEEFRKKSMGSEDGHPDLIEKL